MYKNVNLTNLNKTPVRTKSWLNVNEINLNNLNIPEITKFNNTTIFGDNFKGVTVEKISNNNILPLNKTLTYGVSKDLIKECESKFNEGYIIRISKDYESLKPIIIEFNLDDDNNNLIDNITVIAEEYSKADLIIKYMSSKDILSYHNGLCKVIALENSTVNITKVNLLNKSTIHIDSNYSQVNSLATVNFIEINLGGSHSITNYHGDLISDNSTSNLKSIYIGSQEKIIDMNYIMTHKGRRTNSSIITKGALKDNSKKVFKGTLDFKKGSGKSIGLEDEYCMLLSKTASAKAVPLLLCEEDDISGEHAASSGKIDENKLFYLMSRGLDYNEARKLIVLGSFNPIIDFISNKSLKEEILEYIEGALSYE